MKRLFALMLALLMLCGCATEPPDAGETQADTEAIDSELALERYDLPYDNCLDAIPMGDDILLFTETALVKLDGKSIKEIAAQPALSLDPADPAVQVNETGVSYCADGAVIFLDENLQEISRIALPENAAGSAAVTADMQTIYYAAADAIRAISRETGLDRLLREISFPNLTITALHVNDTILECVVSDESDTTSVLFFSTETGELRYEYLSEISLASDGDFWLAAIGDGAYSQTVFAAGDSGIQALTPPEDHFSLQLIPGLQDVLAVSHGDGTASLSVYDTESGLIASVLALDGTPGLCGVWGDAEENCVWFILDGNQLCRWDLEKSAVDDAVSCIGPYYSRENPDAEGLASLEIAAEELENTYGVQIHIAEDAAAVRPDGYSLVSEYQVDLLKDGLDQLGNALARLTPEFLAGAGKASDDGKVHISLVRSVSGDGCIQFWDDEGDAYIVLAVGTSVEQDFYHALAHIIDARVMSEGSTFDNWERLNPKGFDYTYDYLTTPAWDDSIHADAFIDSHAMRFPTEDRARVFEYAMMADCATYFESETMQKKLSTLCTGIRKAFGLTGSEEELPWEQYLAE